MLRNVSGDESMRVVAWIVVLLLALAPGAFAAGPVIEGRRGKKRMTIWEPTMPGRADLT